MALVKKEAYFNSSNGVNKIRTLIWEDDELTPIGIVQLTHGMAEHIARYDAFASFLASNGFVVCGNDHLGHGKSVSSPEDLGFTAEEDGFRRFVDDMHILYNIMHKRYPDLKYYLFGHSMGSFCARVYAASFSEDLSGLIICGTGQAPNGLEFAINTLRELTVKFGPRTRNKIMAGSLNKVSSLGIKDKTSDLDWLSYNKKNVEAYKNDPLCGIELTLAGMRDLASIALLACDKLWPASVRVGLPILIISGGEDPIGMNGKGPVACADSLIMCGHDPEVIVYPAMRHEILNEEANEKVYLDILGFLNTASF